MGKIYFSEKAIEMIKQAIIRYGKIEIWNCKICFISNMPDPDENASFNEESWQSCTAVFTQDEINDIISSEEKFINQEGGGASQKLVAVDKDSFDRAKRYMKKNKGKFKSAKGPHPPKNYLEIQESYASIS